MRKRVLYGRFRIAIFRAARAARSKPFCGYDCSGRPAPHNATREQPGTGPLQEREESMATLPTKKKKPVSNFRKNLPLHLMLLPAVILIIIFNYIPMGGIVMAFQDYRVTKGLLKSDWVGLENFRFLMSYPDFWNIMKNTLMIACAKLILGLIVPVTFALLINELKNKLFVRITQTLVYLPNFLSWVILGGIFATILSPSGLFNRFLGALGLGNYYFMGDNSLFPGVLIATDVWKNFGYASIIYLAALTGIDPGLYEAAAIDGAKKFRQLLHVTLPGIAPIIFVMAVLSLGSILNAGMDQVMNMYSPQVYKSGDILDTYIYRIGLEQAQYSLSTAASLFKSVVSALLMALAYSLAIKYGNYQLF